MTPPVPKPPITPTQPSPIAKPSVLEAVKKKTGDVLGSIAEAVQVATGSKPTNTLADEVAAFARSKQERMAAAAMQFDQQMQLRNAWKYGKVEHYDLLAMLETTGELLAVKETPLQAKKRLAEAAERPIMPYMGPGAEEKRRHENASPEPVPVKREIKEIYGGRGAIYTEAGVDDVDA